jgi:hypothetical protein
MGLAEPGFSEPVAPGLRVGADHTANKRGGGERDHNFTDHGIFPFKGGAFAAK